MKNVQLSWREISRDTAKSTTHAVFRQLRLPSNKFRFWQSDFTRSVPNWLGRVPHTVFHFHPMEVYPLSFFFRSLFFTSEWSLATETTEDKRLERDREWRNDIGPVTFQCIYTYCIYRIMSFISTMIQRCKIRWVMLADRSMYIWYPVI